jgi:hypothetical protein
MTSLVKRLTSLSDASVVALEAVSIWWLSIENLVPWQSAASVLCG